MSSSIVANAAVASLGRVANVGLGIVTVSLLARFLGGELFGAYTVLMAFCLMLHTAADLGLYVTLTRAIAAAPADRENQYLAHITALRLALLVIVLAIGALTLRFLPSLQNLAAPYALVAAGLAAQSFSQLLMGVYQKYGAMWRATAGDLIGRLVQLVSIILLGTQQATLAAMSFAFALGTATSAAIHQTLLPQTVHVRLAVSWPVWRDLVKESLPVGALLILNAIYFRADALILSFFQSIVQVGLYGLAYRLVESTLFFPAMFGGLLLPRLSAAVAAARGDQLKQYVSQAVAATAWAAAFIAVSFASLAEPIIVLVAGGEFRAAAPLLRILALAQVAMFCGNIAGFTLLAYRQQKSLLVLAAALAAANVILNFATIPYWGAPAAAWTTVLTEAAAALIATSMVFRRTRFRLPRSFLSRLAVATAATAAVYWLLAPRVPVLATLLVGALVYLLGSRLLGLITRRHFSALLTAA